MSCKQFKRFKPIVRLSPKQAKGMRLSSAVRRMVASAVVVFTAATSLKAGEPNPEIGIAVRDVTPELPIRLAGYSARTRAADQIDTHLLVQALAFKNVSGERFVLVSLDNCEVSHAFMEPVLKELDDKQQLGGGTVALVSSHTHSAPVLDKVLTDMGDPPPAERERIAKYSKFLQSNIVEVVGAALADCQPASLEHAVGQTTFAMNRRVFRNDDVVIGENPDGPVDWDVPVLRVKGTNGPCE
jgi:neutral ceramidase